MSNRRHWQSIAFELLSMALERSFNFHKRKFLDPRMELVLLEKGHENLPGEENYTLVVEANEDYLIQDIRQLQADLASIGWRTEGYVQGLRLGSHLYEPLLYSEKVAIHPVALNKSEFQFVNDLRLCRKPMKPACRLRASIYSCCAIWPNAALVFSRQETSLS